MRRGFTLIELLVIIGIMGAMVTVSVVSVRGGQGAARVRGATRDVFAIIRHARSVALVSQQPAIVTYSCTEEDGEPVAKVEITGVKVLDTGKQEEEIQTLSGEPLKKSREEEEAERLQERERRAEERKRARDRTQQPKAAVAGDETAADGEKPKEEEEGTSIEEVLFAPISAEVVRGMRIKVTMEGEELKEGLDEARARPKISVFSNVDYLLSRFKDAKDKKQEAEKDAAKDDKDGKGETEEANQEPVSVVWETNGRVEPHRVWIYPDGSEPSKGLSIKIDRFGAAKVLSEGDEE